jgi:hypothetical protein
MRSSIQVLVLEARLFSMAPALNYQYTVDDIRQLLGEMPNLRVLGVSVEPSGTICSHVGQICAVSESLLTRVY